MQLDGLVPRRVSDLLAEQVRTEPVIALHGPRSAGKSTVLRGFAEAVGGSVIDLDDVEVREAIQGNLAASVRAGAPICVDEYQWVPGILDALKARLNREGSLPGTAIITGSTRQDALPATAQALTGRLHSLVIWPFSQGELGGVRETCSKCSRVMPTPSSALSRRQGRRGPSMSTACAPGGCLSPCVGQSQPELAGSMTSCERPSSAMPSSSAGSASVRRWPTSWGTSRRRPVNC